MATKPLRSIKWPDLPDTYWVVQADGSYQQMTVGNAEQLVATVGVQDKVPYNFRTSGGANDIGDREVDKVIGGTVAWNQYANNPNFSENTTWSAMRGTVSIADGCATVTPTEKYGGIAQSLSAKPFATGHKYLISATCKADSSETLYWGISDNINFTDKKAVNVGTSWANVSTIIGITTNVSTVSGHTLFLRDEHDSDFVPFYVSAFIIFDLTQMFGSTIADYIYSLETATAGAGVAYFRKLFPAPYYAYDAGTLMHVQTSAHKMTGFNQFDKSTAVDGKKINSGTGEEASNAAWARSDYIRVVPNTIYYTNAYGVGQDYTVTLYDANKNYIGYRYITSAGTFNTGDANYVILSTIKADVSVDELVLNLSWDGERDGEYEPYEEHTYPLDSDLVLRGIPKLDANNNLYYDGDEYASDGTVNRRYGIVDLGTLTWAYAASAAGTPLFLGGGATNIKIPGTETVPKIMSAKEFPAKSWADLNGGASATNGINVYIDGSIRIVDSAYTDAATFKTAMSGVYLVYELATPTTESADPYQNPQVVNDWGTEEYVDTRTVPIPVGHDTTYRANLRAKLEMAPDSPSDGDGDYIVRQTNGQNVYVKLVKELPTAPTTDGTYHLKCTVASGTATLSWESDT